VINRQQSAAPQACVEKHQLGFRTGGAYSDACYVRSLLGVVRQCIDSSNLVISRTLYDVLCETKTAAPQWETQ
jgi:hypothetical protein